ncbi:MAG: DNA/RNA non-specific endonuclease [Parachlamydiaceae bacterium]
MPKQLSTRLFLFKPSFWATLITGIAIGIASQQIPQIKMYTDEWVHLIERHDYFQKLKSKTKSSKPQFQVPDEELNIPHYEPEKAFPEHPISSFIVNRTGYSLAYDARTHNPAWVYEHLTADTIKGDTDRSQFRFKEDEVIPKHLRATPADYKGSGLDQGHMAPAADHRRSLDEMEETFYLTNISPQSPQFNRNYWAKLEKHVRDLTQEHHDVYVITGPLYLPYQEGKRRFVKYQVIGKNDVAVPSHFFKVIMMKNKDDQEEVVAYILPNTAISSNTPLDHFRTTTQKVEKAAGLLLFNRQESDVATKIENKLSTNREQSFKKK